MELRAQWYSKTGWYYGNCVYGIVYLVLSVVYAAEWPDQYTFLKTLINILGGSLPFIIDPMRQNEGSVPTAALIKFVSEELAAIMAFLNYFVPPSAPSPDESLAPQPC